MSSTFGLVFAIIALGIVYVVLPVVADAYRRFRGRRTVTCPETQSCEEISFDVARAALTAAFAAPKLVVSRCSRWPDDRDCGQGCVTRIAEPVHAEAANSL